MSRHPTAKWAQTSGEIFLSIELPDAEDVKMDLRSEGRFIFSAVKDGVPYQIDLELFDKINVEESKASVGSRHISYNLKKAEKKWWGRVLKQEGKQPAFLKVDWDRWVDEEEEEEKMKKTIKKPSKNKEISKKKRRKNKNPLQKLIAKFKMSCVCGKL
ncbi:co-chaperone protein p23-1-like [Wolffia australiana]